MKIKVQIFVIEKKVASFPLCETIELLPAGKMMFPFKATNIDKASLASPFFQANIIFTM